MPQRWSQIVFDWGDTLMRDDPFRTDPMYLWPDPVAIPGALELVRRLHSSGIRLSIATDAKASDEQMVRMALDKGGFGRFFGPIFRSVSVGYEKSDPRFWEIVLAKLDTPARDVLVIGNNFPADVASPNKIGIFAIWFNSAASERRSGDLFTTIYKMDEFGDIISLL